MKVSAVYERAARIVRVVALLPVACLEFLSFQYVTVTAHVTSVVNRFVNTFIPHTQIISTRVIREDVPWGGFDEASPRLLTTFFNPLPKSPPTPCFLE